LFAPTSKSREILLSEGIDENKVFLVGNTVVDALYQNLEIAQSKSQIFDTLGVKSYQYMLATAHRQENVDDKKKFSGLICGLQKVQNEFRIPLIYPIHPRAKKQLDKFQIDYTGITFVEPLDYLAFLQLESKAKLVLTDSGGVQEETCILGVPCVTLRDNTERPETVEVGSNILVGTDPERILEASKISLDDKRKWANPFGDGTTGEKILLILNEKLNESKKSHK
jgi:UDP-N-acetylglucosamine 2-epimerase (non-hydrolysing)